MTNERAAATARRILEGDRRAAARAMTWVEDGDPAAPELMAHLAPSLGRAHRVGVTGPPGAGKSTIVDRLASLACSRGLTVGVVAVDPSSPFSGGALLGDRVRMTRALRDPRVFVRSMATRGSLGGLARTAQEVADILDALGKDLIFIETVGVGQAELAVAGATDTTVVVLVPEAGGAVQALKAGLMEIADIFVVNKSDRPGAEEMARQLIEYCRDLDPRRERPVLQTSATGGVGMAELFDAIAAHRRRLQEEGLLEEKRREQSRSRIRELVRARLEERLWEDAEIRAVLEDLAAACQSGEVGLYQAATRFWERIRGVLARAPLFPDQESSEVSG